MSNRVSFILTLQDKMSGGIASIGRTGRNVFEQLDRSQDNLQREMDETAAKTKKVRDGFSGIGNTIRNLIGVYAGFELGKKIITLGAEAEQTRIAFQTLTQSVEGGNAMFDMLNNLANQTPFVNSVLQKNAQTLLSFGISASKIEPTLRMLGDVSGGNSEKLQSLTLAFSQMQSAGKLMGQDLLQMINAGFNPLQELSRTTGKSMAVLKDEMSKGGITADMVTSAFQSATSKGGMFFKMMEKQSQTTAGRWSTLMGKLELLGQKIGTALLPVINWLISFSQMLIENENRLKTFGKIVLVAAGAFAVFKTVTLISTAATLGFRGAFMALNMVMRANPLGLIVTALGAVVAAVVWAWDTFEGFRGVIMGVWESVKTVFGNIANFAMKMIAPVADMIQAIKSGNWADAAKAGGKLLLNAATVPHQFALALAKGDITKGVGESYKSGYDKGVDSFKKANEKKKEKDPASILAGLNTKTPDTVATAATLGGGGLVGLGITSGQTKEASSLQAGIAGVSSDSGAAKNITVTIERLIENFQISTTNVTEGVQRAKELVTQGLIEAVRDMEVSYGQ